VTLHRVALAPAGRTWDGGRGSTTASVPAEDWCAGGRTCSAGDGVADVGWSVEPEVDSLEDDEVEAVPGAGRSPLGCELVSPCTTA
jgi:hypothetical protein